MKEKEYRKVLLKSTLEQREEIFVDMLHVFFAEFISKFERSATECKAVFEVRNNAWKRLSQEFPIGFDDFEDPIHFHESTFHTLLYAVSNKDDDDVREIFKKEGADLDLADEILELIDVDYFRETMEKIFRGKTKL